MPRIEDSRRSLARVGRLVRHGMLRSLLHSSAVRAVPLQPYGYKLMSLIMAALGSGSLHLLSAVRHVASSKGSELIPEGTGDRAVGRCAARGGVPQGRCRGASKGGGCSIPWRTVSGSGWKGSGRDVKMTTSRRQQQDRSTGSRCRLFREHLPGACRHVPP